MLKKRMLALIFAVVALASALAAAAQPAAAQKLLGCDSKLQWPCPGPMP